MLETPNPEIDVTALLDRIQSEIDAYTQNHPFAEQSDKTDALPEDLSLEVNDPYEWPQLNTTLGIADQNAEIGTRVSSMLHFPKPLRFPARIMAKIVNYLATSITVTQRHFNQAILHLLRIILDGIRDMNLGIAEMRQGFIARMRSSEQRLEAIEKDEKLKILSRKVDQLKTDLVFQERRLAVITEEARRRLPQQWDAEQLHTVAQESEHLMDPLYVAFEDQFRGSRAEIKERLAAYLPIMEAAQAGTESRPIYDFGCGRGEWLEVLKSHHLHATGIDLNQVLIAENQERGLNAIYGDALKYLKEMPNDHAGAVTAFHLIEHLPHGVLIELFDESLRVLKPRGLAIFETPNPQNLTVGASTFWSDPTHRKPLHPETQRFLLEYRGFTRVELKFLHPLEEHQLLPGEEAPKLAATLNSLLGCARDFAVIGYKA